jgi:hypothetical protein
VQNEHLRNLVADGKTGFREVIGSWKIMAMRLPRISRICCIVRSSRFIPSNWMRPSTILPGGSGIKRMIDWAVTLFPLPDSPTTPSTSPAER